MTTKEKVLTTALFILTIVAAVFLTNVISGLSTTGQIHNLKVRVEDAAKDLEEMTSERDNKTRLLEEYKSFNPDTAKDQIDDLNEKLVKANKEIERLNKELTKLKNNSSKPGNTYHGDSTNKDLLGSYISHTGLDDERASNLLNAIAKLDGTELKSGDKLSLYSILGPFNSDNGYVETLDSNYGLGTEYLVNGVFKATMKSNMSAISLSKDGAGLAFVDSDTDLVIKNSISYDTVINCSFDRGDIKVEVVRQP